MLTRPKPIRILRRFFDVHSACRRLLSQNDKLTQEERRLVAAINKTISLNDQMYATSPEHYFMVGLSAMRNISAAIAMSSLETVNSILDFPCGHGRELRYLVKGFPNAIVSAGDIDTEAVAFCKKTFGTIAVGSNLNFQLIDLAAQYDLIWCGSLITHLNESASLDLLDFLSRHLNPGGLLLITVHGDFVFQRFEHQFHMYSITEQAARSIRESYNRIGYGYADYPGNSQYGISACTTEWMRKQSQKLGLSECYFKPRGWDDHQDVLGFIKQGNRS